MSLLLQYIAEGEHQQQDFKLRIDDAKKIAITLSAFSNCQGGRLLIGVKDNGNIAGLKSVEEEYHMIEAAATMYCKPAVKVTPTVVREQGKNVLIISLDPAVNRPVFAKNPDEKWRAYLRKADENFMMNRVLAKSLALLPEDKNTFAFTPQILSFLKEMQVRDSFGFNITRRKLKVSPKTAEQLLAILIRWDVIGYEVNAHGIQYFVEKDPELSELYQD